MKEPDPEWKVQMKAWQAQHPGYCGLCGLPFERCFHRDAKYRAETQPLIQQNRFRESSQVMAHWYLTRLNEMGLDEVRLLPVPPKEHARSLRKQWLEDRLRSKTRWQVLLDEP